MTVSHCGLLLAVGNDEIVSRMPGKRLRSAALIAVIATLASGCGSEEPDDIMSDPRLRSSVGAPTDADLKAFGRCKTISVPDGLDHVQGDLITSTTPINAMIRFCAAVISRSAHGHGGRTLYGYTRAEPIGEVTDGVVVEFDIQKVKVTAGFDSVGGPPEQAWSSKPGSVSALTGDLGCATLGTKSYASSSSKVKITVHRGDRQLSGTAEMESGTDYRTFKHLC